MKGSKLDRQINQFEFVVRRRGAISTVWVATQTLKILRRCVKDCTIPTTTAATNAAGDNTDSKQTPMTTASNKQTADVEDNIQNKFNEAIEKSLHSVTKRLIASIPSTVIVSNYCHRVIDMMNEELHKSKSASMLDLSIDFSGAHNDYSSHDVRRSKSFSFIEILAGPMTSTFSSSDIKNILIDNMPMLTDETIKNTNNSNTNNNNNNNNNDKSSNIVIGGNNDNNNDDNVSGNSLKNSLLNGIDDLLMDVPNTYEDIAAYSDDYIYNGDILLTVGYSTTVFAFFKRAAEKKKRRFTVLVTEHAPFYDGIEMANKIRKELKIECCVVPDSAVFVIMPRVTKVFCSCRAVFADGSFVTTSFVQSVALAARHYSKPLIVLYWKCKLTDRFLVPNNESFTILTGPMGLMEDDGTVSSATSTSTTTNSLMATSENNGILEARRKSRATELMRRKMETLVVICPDGDFVNVSSATLFISEDGPHSPTDIFTHMQNLYRPNE